MIGRVRTNPITGVKYAETLAGPTGGTVQALDFCADNDYDLVLGSGTRNEDGETYVGVSCACPITYNPDSGTLSVCTLHVECIDGQADADRVIVTEDPGLLHNSKRLAFVDDFVTENGVTTAHVYFVDNIRTAYCAQTGQRSMVFPGMCLCIQCGICVSCGVTCTYEFRTTCSACGSWCDFWRSSMFALRIPEDNSAYWPVLGMYTPAEDVIKCRGWSLGTYKQCMAFAYHNGDNNSGGTYWICDCAACGGMILTTGSISACSYVSTSALTSTLNSCNYVNTSTLNSCGYTKCTGNVRGCLCGSTLCLSIS